MVLEQRHSGRRWLDYCGKEGCCICGSRPVKNRWTLLFVKNTFTSVEYEWFWTYISDVLGAVNEWGFENVRGDSHVDRLEKLIRRYE